MRSFVVVGALAALAGCSAANPSAQTAASAQPKIVWQYGAGNGDGVSYPGPAPKFSRAYGVNADQVGTPATTPTMNYGWGAEGQTGNVAMGTPDPQQRVASPAPSPNPTPAERAAAPGTHS